MTTILDAALALAARGWPVFPCEPSQKPQPRSKAPLTTNGLKDATTDPASIQDWWERWPKALIGLPTGEPLGAFVVDLDPRTLSCEELFEALEKHIGTSVGDPVTAVTQSGGWHLYFALPQGEAAAGIRNRAGQRSGLVANVDVRGNGGYVIAPPSVMSDGKAYAWRQRDDGQRGLTEAPPELIDAILRRGAFCANDGEKTTVRPPDAGERARKYALAALDAEVCGLRDAPDGTRNDRLNVAAFALGQLVGAGALVESVACAALEEVASAWPNLKKSRGTIRSGLSAGITKPRDLGAVERPLAKEAPERPMMKRPGEGEARVVGDVWTNPDLSVLDAGAIAARFPTERLGGMWADWIELRAKAASAPEDYVAASLLACAGAALANVRWPIVGAGWSEPSHLWIGLVGSPSSGKSPGMSAAVDLLEQAESALRAGFDDKLKEFKEVEAFAKARKAFWETQVSEAARRGEDRPPMPSDAVPPDRPICPRIRVVDATSEKLAELSAALPRGLIQVRDELGGWLGAFDRYGGLGADRSFALETWNGGRYTVDRKKADEPVQVRHLSIGVLGGIQPERLAPIIEGPDDGLPTRFLWAWPDRIPLFRIHREPIDDGPAREAFARLARLTNGSDGFGNPEPKRLRLTNDALLVLEEFGQDAAARGQDYVGPLAGSLGKARGHALRLANVIAHLIWAADPGAPELEEVDGKSMFSAVSIMKDYFIPTAERVFRDAAAPQLDRAAMRLARFLRANSVAEFTFRDLRRRMSGELREIPALEAACAELEEAGCIRLRPSPRIRSRGRPSKVYDVHPALSRVRSVQAVR